MRSAIFFFIISLRTLTTADSLHLARVATRERVIPVTLYTVPEVTRILRVKKAYVYELVAQGRIRALRLSERRIRIPQEALEEFVRQETDRAAAK